MTIPRGSATEDIFDRTITATWIRHDALTGEDDAKPISADEAAELFAQNPDAGMQCRADGVYAFVIRSSAQGYERVEIEADG